MKGVIKTMFGIFKKGILNDKTSDLKVKDIRIKYNLSEKDWEEQKRRYKANCGNGLDTSYSYGNSYSSGSSDYSSSSSCD